MEPTYATRKAALIKAISLGTGLPEASVIWTDQNVGRPQKPYIAANITRFKELGREIELPLDSNGFGGLLTHWECRLVLQLFSDDAGIVDTENMGIELAQYLNMQNGKELFDSQGLVFVGVVNGPNCVSTKVDADWEIRSLMELLIRMPWETTDKSQGLIEAVSIEGIALNIDGSTVMDKDFTVGTPYTPTQFTLAGCVITAAADPLFQQLAVTKGANPYLFAYSAMTTVTLNANPALITDLLPGDNADILYFEYHGAHNALTITATRLP